MKFDFKGGIFWPLRTLWRNLRMFLDILKPIVENKNNYLRKTVLKIRSQILRLIAYVSTKLLLKKMQKRNIFFLKNHEND